MKKILFSVLTLFAAVLLTGCGNGSSGTKMLDLDVRYAPTDEDKQDAEKSYYKDRELFEGFTNLFTVLPGPYEFTWEELKNQDGATGREMCSTKLKIRLRLNKTLKPVDDGGYEPGEEKRMDNLARSFFFYGFNAEGKTLLELADENDDNSSLLFVGSLDVINGVDGKIGFKKNTDGMRDFYQFLTGKSGTEFDLIIDCGIQLCKDIENIMAYNKGMYIRPNKAITTSGYKYIIE